MMMSTTSLVDLYFSKEKKENDHFPFSLPLFIEFFSFSFFLLLGFDLGNLFFFSEIIPFEIEDFFYDYSFGVFSLFDFGFIFYTFFFLVFLLLGFVLLFGLLAAMIIVN